VAEETLSFVKLLFQKQPLTTVYPRTHTKYLTTAGVRGRVRNFLLRIPLTSRENSGNVSGKFFQRNNCRSRDIAGESRPRAGNMLRERTEQERKRTKAYIIFHYARHPTIMHSVRCMGSITYHNKYESTF